MQKKIRQTNISHIFYTYRYAQYSFFSPLKLILIFFFWNMCFYKLKTISSESVVYLWGDLTLPPISKTRIMISVVEYYINNISYTCTNGKPLTL